MRSARAADDSARCPYGGTQQSGNPLSGHYPDIFSAAWRWWKELADREGWFAATRALTGSLLEFARDSTPGRLRQRYGDAEYDWNHRVNTTGAAVGWRDRLLGVFHSAYQPTEPALFHEMLGALRENLRVDFREFTFIDLGSGKGRTLLMASDYAFKKIIGVELLPSLDAIARQNLEEYKSEARVCFDAESVCGDASGFDFPGGALLIYLFNPFPEAGLRRVLARLEQSFRANPRRIYVLYHNPILDHVLKESSALRRVGGTHQYSVFATEAAGS